MSSDIKPEIAPYSAPEKDLYEIGEMPPLGYVPKSMYAWAIRRERHGEPDQSFQVEVVETPALDSQDVLVLVIAAGVNYNGVWASLGVPISPFDVHKAEYHIAGSDASGIVWAVGGKGTRWKVGDEVVIHCNQDDGDDAECNGGDPMFSPSQRIWGYETPNGSFAQFTRVQAQQLMPRPKHLTWEESACYTLTLATAYRMLFGHHPHELKPGQNVLVWGASGGLGSFAIQLINAAGGNAIGVISDEDKRVFVVVLGAKGVLNRKDFKCWGQLPTVNTDDYKSWFSEVRKFGKAIWEITGKGNNVDMVFEHPGEATFPVSTFVCKKGRYGGDLCWYLRVQSYDGCTVCLDASKADSRQPLCPSETSLSCQQTDGGTQDRSLYVRSVCLGRYSLCAYDDVAKCVQARKYGGSGAGTNQWLAKL
jgi:crotonyl-CoA carboxylase/reductase